MITYDYGAIEDALAKMTAIAGRIIDATDAQQREVQQTLEGWVGKTRDQYNQLCDDLESDLRNNVQFLTDLSQRLRSGSEDMRLQDATSAAQLGRG